MPHDKSQDERGDKGGKDINEVNEIHEIDQTVEKSTEKTVEGSIDKNEDGGDQVHQLGDKSTLKLRDHLERLPQELYDNIYDLTFAAASKLCIYAPRNILDLWNVGNRYPKRIISINEKLPHLLHVDRRSRAKFAQSFFGNDTSFLAIHSSALASLCIENRHLELVNELLFVPEHSPELERHVEEAREDIIVYGGIEAAVSERFEIMSAVELVVRCEDHACRLMEGRVRPHDIVDEP
ncbi:hypothetical protein CKM354_000442300 [Cercospora kikuchii]|uniref:Uncharacterized protein n=1 Tax=Cercospora kikuchii TaxID=84275 RepID=A0A9P3CGT5_9PEZI|nr:uncharacterized protein CKM354_000442300 [Cercospora kikuchii]GIZ41107.1 hypothetical protein CKM354_000442300 [Cercospora kikuchii]